MNKVISINELAQVLDKMSKRKFEDEWNSWGKVTPTHTEYVEASDVLYCVKQFLNKKYDKK